MFSIASVTWSAITLYPATTAAGANTAPNIGANAENELPNPAVDTFIADVASAIIGNLSLITPNPSTKSPAPLITPTPTFDNAPKAMTVAPVLTTARFCSSSICDNPFAKSATVVLASFIDGNIVSPILLAASTILFLVTDNCDAVVSFFASNSFCNAMFSFHAVFERVTASVIPASLFAKRNKESRKRTSVNPISCNILIAFSPAPSAFCRPLMNASIASAGDESNKFLNSSVVFPVILAKFSNCTPDEIIEFSSVLV